MPGNMRSSTTNEGGGVLTILIAVVTLGFQLSDPTYRVGVIGVMVWLFLGIAYFFFVGRHALVKSPEEEFALQRDA